MDRRDPDEMIGDGPQSNRSPLIVVRMTVAPIPVVPLDAVVLPVVLTITPVLCCQVTPVGALFVVIPVMVIAVVLIVDSDLHAGLLRFRLGYN